MRLKTFFANDMKDALSAMRTELGDDAIIVASETMKDGTVLLRAGIEVESPPAPADGDLQSRPPHADNQDGAQLLSFDAQYRNALLARLRAPGVSAARPVSAFDRQALAVQLLAHRVPDGLAETLAARAEECALADASLALATVLDRETKSSPFALHSARAVFLLGLPGSGKTSVAAKLAAHARLANIPVQLAMTDLESAGQVARLEALARCLEVETLKTPTADALGQAMQAARANNVLLIVDSVGCHPAQSLVPELRGYLSLDGLEILAVMSAAGDAQEAGESAARFASLGATHLIATGLDLTRRKGTLLTLAQSPLSFAFTTASPYLSAGLQTLTPLTLSRALLADDDNSGVVLRIA